MPRLRSGLDRVVIPFIDKGIPVEYELVRSICTVAQQKRKKLGVVKTDVPLFGGFSMQGQTRRNRKLVDGAEEAVRRGRGRSVEADHKDYDVLLAVQPSALNRQRR